MSSGTFRFIMGIALGYVLVQGVIYLNANYLWAVFH